MSELSGWNSFWDSDQVNEAARKLARRTDPETSHKAAEDIAPKLSERRREVLELVARFPGFTANELGLEFFKRYHQPGVRGSKPCLNAPSQRMNELESSGYVHSPYQRRCRDSGGMCEVWHITRLGREALK